MTLQTYYVNGDVLWAETVNWVNGIIPNKVEYTYNLDGTVDTITETVEGSTITSTFTYNLDGTVDEIIESRDGKTITTKFTYDAGVITETNRTVT